MNNDFEENPREVSKRSRAHSVARSLKADFKENVIGTSRNPFINFLLEFKKITPTLKMNAAQLAKIGGEMWRNMNAKQKSQFQIVEARRRRRGRRPKRAKRRGRRRRGRRHSLASGAKSDA